MRRRQRRDGHELVVGLSAREVVLAAEIHGDGGRRAEVAGGDGDGVGDDCRDRRGWMSSGRAIDGWQMEEARALKKTTDAMESASRQRVGGRAGW